MSLHPDADAFVRAILDDPAELTTRLVFADWLEETGVPSNVAWARFIRLMAEIATCPPGVRREDLITATYDYIPKIRARLRIPAAAFVTGFPDLEHLLPLERFTVHLRGFAPDPFTTACFRRDHLLPYRVLPLGWKRDNRDVLIAAIAELRGAEMVAEDLTTLYGFRDVITVLTPDAVLLHQTINGHFPAPPGDCTGHFVSTALY